MEYAVLNELISTLGFPITVCIALFYQNRRTEAHYERIVLQFTKSIQQNTATLSALIRKLEEKEND